MNFSESIYDVLPKNRFGRGVYSKSNTLKFWLKQEWYRKSGFWHTKAVTSMTRGKIGPRLLLMSLNLNLNFIVDGPGSSSAFDVHIVPICVQSRLETVH